MKNKIFNALLNLQFIFKPSYWLMNDDYSKELDLIINKLLDDNDFIITSKYVAKLGKFNIWIGNRPYACMVFDSESYFRGKRPSRLTIKRGLKKLEQPLSEYNRLESIKFLKKYN